MSPKAKPPSQPKKNKLSQKGVAAKTAKSVRIVATPTSGEKESKQLTLLKQRAGELAALQATILDISSPRPLPELLNLIMERSCNLLRASSGGIYLCDAEKQQLNCVVSYKTVLDFTGTILKFGEGAAGTVVQTGKPLIIDDYRIWPGRAQVYDQTQPFSAVIAVPLIWQDTVTGVIDVVRAENAPTFTQEDLELLNLFAAHAALAVENARLYNILEQDLTERKQTEKALRESERLLRESQYIAGLGSYTLEIPSGKWVSSNVLNKIFGIDEKFEHTFEDWVTLIHPDDRQMMVNYFENEVVGKHARFDKEYRIIRNNDQAERWVHGLGELEVNSQNQLIKMLGIIQDITERKLADEKLRRNENRLHLAQTIARLGIWDWDITTDKTIWSGEMFNIYGITPEIFTGNGQDYINFTHPEDRSIQISNIQKSFERAALHAKPPLPLEDVNTNSEIEPRQFRIIRPDKSICWVEGEAVAIVDNTGQPVKMIGVLVDITERKNAEAALQEAEIKYRMLVERLPVVVYTSELGINGVWRYISPQIEQLLGFTVDEWAADSGLWYRQVHPEDRDRQEKLEEQAWARQEAFEGEYRMFTRDGRLIWIRDSAQILPAQNNSAPIVQGILMDITERKLAEDALATSEAELRALFISMQDVVLVIDREGVYRKIAPTNPDLLYKPSQEMLGKNLRDLLPAEQADVFFNAIQRVLKTQQTAQIEYSLPIGDHMAWFAASISLMDADNTLWVARDITESKQAEEALRKSDQRLQVFFNQSLDGFFFCNFEEPKEWKNAKNKTDILETIVTTQRFTDVNDAMLKQYGISRERFLSFTTKDVFAHDIEQGRKLRRELFDKGRLHVETFERTGDGASVWFEGDYVCLYDEKERITGFFGIQRDITERKLAEQVQSALYEIANVAQTAVSLNDLFASIHKTLETFMPAENFYIAIYDSQKDLLSFPYFIDEFDKAPAPQKPVNGLTEYVLRTRQPLLATPQVFKEMIKSKQVDLLGVASFDWIGVPLSIGDEAFGVMVVQTYTDKIRLTQKDLELMTFVSTQVAMVIKRKQAEETLLQFREIMDESNDAIYFIDPETSRYIDFNKNAMEFLGYNKEELSQLGVIGISQQVTSMEEWRERVDLIDKSNGIVFQTSYRRKDDSFFPVEVSARILNYEGKSIMVTVVRDITERTQAEAARERQLQELTGLHAIASACAFAVDEDSLLTVASILIGDVLYPEDFGFFLVDKEGLLRPHPSYHQKNGVPNEFIRPGKGLIGQAAQEGQAHRSGDVRLEKNYIIASPTSLSELAVPIKINEHVLGVINAESNKLNAFSEADERLLSTAADQIATALERIRLQNETTQRAKEFASLYETSTTLSAENNLTALLQIIVEHAATLLNASTGAIYLFNKSAQDLETVVATSADIPLGIHLHLGEGVAGRTAQTQLPMRIDDYSTWEGRSPKFDGLIFHAILEVPMLFGGELIGVLTAAEMGESRRKFTEADERLLSLFAAQAAGAIHLARLRDETAQRAQEFASLYETSKALSTEHDLNKLLRSVVENARNLLNTATSGMYLTIPGSDELELSMDTAPYIPLGSRIKLGEGVAGRVAETRQPLRIDNYSTWEGRSTIYGESPVRAVVEVPMLYRGELIGVLTADEAGNSERKFTEADEHLLSLFATQAAGAIHSARLLEETRRRAEEFTTLYETTHDLAMQQELSIVLDIITKRATTLLGVPNAAIILYDPMYNDLKIAATRGPDLTIGTHRKIGEGLAGRVAQSRLPLIIDDYSKWEHRSHLYDTIPYTAMMGVPLLYGGNLLGVLDVSDIAPSKRTFNESDIRLLSLFAGQAASAIANAQLFEDLKKSNIDLMSAYDTTIEGWSRAMDLRDHETEGHTLRVTDLTLKLARGMHLSETQLMHIRRGSLLHDIGKMGVPDAILLKEGNLSDEEWIIMRKHPQLAYEMLSSIDYLHEALDIPSNHHEKWDGTGYPRKLKGDEIPLAARIFSVVDVWDAIRSDRPYRKGWNAEKAIEYIKSQSGTHFDPNIVESFLKLINEQSEKQVQ